MNMVPQAALPQWAAFPLKQGQKEPNVVLWQITTPHSYTNRGGHFGILPGNSIANAQETFLVIDTDFHKLESLAEQEAALARLKSAIPNLEKTVTIRTPKGGRHYYFRVPQGFRCKRIQPNFPHCDFQSSMYVVAPHMVTTAGQSRAAGTYELIHPYGTNFYSLPYQYFEQLPVEFLASLQTASSNEEFAKSPKPELFTLSRRPDFQRLCETDYPAAIQGKNGDNTTLKLAQRGFDFGLPEDTVCEDMLTLYNPRCQPQWSREELCKKVRNARKYRQDEIGRDTPERTWLPFLSETSQLQSLTSEEITERLQEQAKHAQAMGFELGSDGLYKVHKPTPRDPRERIKISDPIMVMALSFGDYEGGSFYVVRLQDRLGKIRELDIPVKLQTDSKLLAQRLVDVFQFEKSDDLCVFLSRMHPETTLQSVKRTGWRIPDNDNEKPIFVLPGIETPGIRFVGDSDLTSSMVPKGMLKDWQDSVWQHSQFPTARYEVYKSLAPALIPFSNSAECMHENIGGLSSTGKTTHLQIGASVWGRAEFPARNGKSSFIIPWNGTAKYMQEIISYRNNLPTYLDEIGSKDAGDFGQFIYAVSSGSERGRCNTDGSSKETRKFQTSITSSGEITIRTAIEAKNFGSKAIAKAGQLVRYTDRKLSESFASAAQVDRIKSGCSNYHGTLGPAFVQWLSALSLLELRHKIEPLFQTALNRLNLRLPKDSSEVQRRGLQRFAIAEVAGKILAETGLLQGITEALVESDINAVTDSWMHESHLISDAERAVEAIKDHVTRCRDSHFKTYSRRTRIVQTPDSVTREIEVSDDIRFKEGLSGEIDQAGNRFFLYPEAMAEITGMKATDVAKELLKRGLLLPEQTRADHNRLTGRATVEGKQVTVYWISLNLIEDAKPYTWDDVL